MSEPRTESPSLPVERQNYSAKWWDPQTLVQASEMAASIAKSHLVPNDYRGKPGDIVVAWSLGASLGLSLLSSLTHIAVINGRPSIWGDGAMAVVLAHPDCEYVREEMTGSGDEQTAICIVKRKGAPEAARTFSVRDAKKAGLWTKKGPWTNYPNRMLQLRARGFALRDQFADALCGMPIAEEVRDITPTTTVVDEPQGSTATERLKNRLRTAEKAPGSPQETRSESERVVAPTEEPEPVEGHSEPQEDNAEDRNEKGIEDYIRAATTPDELLRIKDAVWDKARHDKITRERTADLLQLIGLRSEELAG